MSRQFLLPWLYFLFVCCSTLSVSGQHIIGGSVIYPQPLPPTSDIYKYGVGIQFTYRVYDPRNRYAISIDAGYERMSATQSAREFFRRNFIPFESVKLDPGFHVHFTTTNPKIDPFIGLIGNFRIISLGTTRRSENKVDLQAGLSLAGGILYNLNPRLYLSVRPQYTVLFYSFFEDQGPNGWGLDTNFGNWEHYFSLAVGVQYMLGKKRNSPRPPKLE